VKLTESDTIMDLSGKFKNADTKNLYSMLSFFKNMNVEANASGSWSVKGTASAPTVKANVRTGSGRFMDMRVDRFASDISYGSGKLTLSPMRISAYEGSAALNCEVLLSSNSAQTPWSVSGKANGVDLSVLNGILRTSEDIDGKCTLDITAGDNGSGIKWKAVIGDASPRWTTFKTERMSGTISGTTESVNIEKMSVNFLRGEHTIKGTVKLPPKGRPSGETAIDIDISSKNINMYEALRKYLPAVRGIQGLIKADVSISGTAKDPQFSGKGTLAPLRYRGFLLPMVDVDFSGSMTEIRVSRAEAKLSGGKIFGSAKMFKKGEDWNSVVDAKGISVDIRQFGAYLPDKFRAGLGGRVNFNMHGSGKVGAFEGKGTFSSKRMKFMGLNLKNITAPFFITDG
ncbi:MAG: hypothetical protein RR214_08050, partial [Synergistaceae bacterium]